MVDRYSNSVQAPLLDRLDVGEIPLVDVRKAARINTLPGDFCLVFVGGSCAGKSTLASSLAESPMPVKFEIAGRVSTRQARQGDRAEGTSHISWDEYQELVGSGALALAWIRPMPDGTAIGYGCLPVSPGRLPIYMAGHGVYTNVETVRPYDVLDKALIVGVSAPYRVRCERLRGRSPDVFAQGEHVVQNTMAHDDDAMVNAVDLIVQNESQGWEEAARQLRRLMAAIVSDRRPRSS